MREILFRGKRIDNGEWVFGAYFPESAPYPATIFNGRHNSRGDYVKTETIGQFTGLTDKHGKKIFEGDIVTNSDRYKYIVKYGRHDLDCCGCCYRSHESVGFFLADERDYALSDEEVWGNIEVIGNIHDNPKLLKRGAQHG